MHWKRNKRFGKMFVFTIGLLEREVDLDQLLFKKKNKISTYFERLEKCLE